METSQVGEELNVDSWLKKQRSDVCSSIFNKRKIIISGLVKLTQNELKEFIDDLDINLIIFKKRLSQKHYYKKQYYISVLCAVCTKKNDKFPINDTIPFDVIDLISSYAHSQTVYCIAGDNCMNPKSKVHIKNNSNIQKNYQNLIPVAKSKNYICDYKWCFIKSPNTYIYCQYESSPGRYCCKLINPIKHQIDFTQGLSYNRYQCAGHQPACAKCKKIYKKSAKQCNICIGCNKYLCYENQCIKTSMVYDTFEPDINSWVKKKILCQVCNSFVEIEYCDICAYKFRGFDTSQKNNQLQRYKKIHQNYYGCSGVFNLEDLIL